MQYLSIKMQRTAKSQRLGGGQEETEEDIPCDLGKKVTKYRIHQTLLKDVIFVYLFLV